MNKDKLTIYYFSGTHWDREWYQSFQGFRYRLVTMMNEMIELLEKNPEFKVFHFDGQTIMLEDYLEIEPEKKERLYKLIQDGRILIGPWYVMPDEFLLSGESIIRNLVIGHRICREWSVESWKYGYICDIFGHVAQTPQIFNGFGIKYALLGRGTNEHTCPSHFVWQSPDGSECITFKVDDHSGYGAFCTDVIGWEGNNVFEPVTDRRAAAKKYIEKELKKSEIPVVVIMDGMDHERIHADTPDYIKLVEEFYPDADIHHVNLENMGRQLENYRSLLPVKKGELNETAKISGPFLHLISNTLSSRYPIKKANDQCQTLLEKLVEPVCAIWNMKGFKIQKSYIDLAYRHLIQNHPHDSICGCSIDQVHKDMEYRFDQARMICCQVMEEIDNFEAEKLKSERISEKMLLRIFNPLPFARREVITAELGFRSGYSCIYEEQFGYELKNSFRIVDCNDNEIPYGLLSIKRNYKVRRYNQYVEKLNLHEISMEVDVPAMGFAEYAILSSEKPSRYLECMTRSENEAENEYISLKINEDGTLAICDKTTEKTYDKLVSYLDDGEIGDGWFHANPVQDLLVSSQGSPCTVERLENSPSRVVFRITHYLKVPESMTYGEKDVRRSEKHVELKISSNIALSKGTPWVDVETTVSNNTRDHRLRMKLPTGLFSPTYFVNQPFAFVERKVGINIETQEWKECEALEKQTGGIVFRRAEDGNGLAFVSAYGLHECACPDDTAGSIIVTLLRSFSKTYTTNGEVTGQIQGDLQFKYRLVPMQTDTGFADLVRIQDGLQAGVRTNALHVPENVKPAAPVSHFELLGQDVCMSILKKPENRDEDNVVVRLCNMSGKSSKGALKCFKSISSASKVNLNEEFLEPAEFTENTLQVDLGPWKIQTYSLRLRV